MKYLYRIHRTNQSEYGHLHLEIIEQKKSILSHRFGPCETEVAFRWQSHHNSNEWYGNEVRIETKNVQALIRATKFVKKFCGDGFVPSPDKLIESLHKTGINRCVYDARVSEFLPVEEVKPSTYVRWLATGSAGNCYVSTVAPENDQNEATRKLAKELANYSVDAFEDWVLAGKKVKVDAYSKPPTIPDFDIKPL